MLKIQSPPYTDYTSWNENKQDDFNEILRYSMLVFRNNSMTAYQEFLQILKKHSNRNNGSTSQLSLMDLDINND